MFYRKYESDISRMSVHLVGGQEKPETRDRFETDLFIDLLKNELSMSILYSSIANELMVSQH
jgi:hypothetical protein